jgi:protein-disulfide isomerase
MDKTGAALSFLLVAAVGCGSQHADDRTTKAQIDATKSRVVAETDGITITLEELDRKAADRLLPLRQQEYEARRQALDDVLEDKLIAREAAKRGIPVAELIKTEVEAKAEAPRPADVEAIYEQNRGRVGGRSLDEVRPDIEKLILDRNRAARQQAFGKELARKAAVHIHLDPPRFDVALPASAPSRGPKDAPITIVEFADFQCPYCKRAEHVLEEVLAKYPDKIRFVHGDLPIEGHSGAFPASRAARCAGEQGKFWEYRRDLLVNQSNFAEADLKARAQNLGLNAGSFDSCLASGRHDGVIKEAQAEATKLGVSSTPTFFVNGRMILGARPAEAFHEVIGEELAGPPRSETKGSP